MNRSLRLLTVAIAASLTLAGAIWLYAQESDDDRPPIIVRSGSIKFDGGDANQASDPRKCCRNWKRDWIGEQWKPDESASDVGTFAVTATSGGCPASTVSGETVEVDYTDNNKTQTFTFYIEPYFLFGTDEPKLDSPVKLHNTPQAKAVAPKRGSQAPGMLDYGNPGHGAITRVKVGNGSPCTPSGPAVISIQPKKKQP